MASIWAAPIVVAATWCVPAWAVEPPGAVRFREHVQPILETYCYGCHGLGAKEGNRTLDEFASDEAMLGNVDLWWAVLKNLRAGIMPPAGEERPSDDERRQVLEWIKFDVFRIDPANPDPGRVTLRRLNRVEYRNTIHDLTGVDYNTTELFPVDDSGYGFDNIGDVLSMSPLLMEKYLQAAEKIVNEAVPKVSRVVAERQIGGRGFHSDDGPVRGDRMRYSKPAVVGRPFKAEHDGKYHVTVELEVDGEFEFDAARVRLTFRSDDKELHQDEYGWADREKKRFEVDVDWTAGEHELSFEVEPLETEDEPRDTMTLILRTVLIKGPLEEEHWIEPRAYRRFFPRGQAPEDEAARDAYAREVIAAFARRAYRRPADDKHLDGLAALAKATYSQPGETFETGVARAMVAVLASPRFIFRIEDAVDEPADQPYPLVDEYALASRLSYLLWSTMPDDELSDLAERGELRANLAAQVKRMIEDDRSEAFVENFAGQWLRARDVEHVTVYPISIMGLDAEYERVREEFRALRFGRNRRGDGQRRRRRGGREERENREIPENETAEQKAEREKREQEERERRERFEKLQAERERFDKLREMFTRELRQAMRRETQMTFEYVMRKDRSLLELIDGNYTFLNETLAKHYGIEGVEGDEMRRVELPDDSPRGGLLTQGSFLVVTSNPTRTSPVKRGLFILDNLMGTPPPPPPPTVPPLEKSGDTITDHEPTIRELQELHRREPLCQACHARMDPLGLALENFNALGMYRDKDKGQAIDTTGELLTGEKFDGIRDLKTIIKRDHRDDFYRCVAQKMLTYALGRGLEYYDEHAVDTIVAGLDEQDGKFSALVTGVVNSAPFQRERRPEKVAVSR